MSAMTLMSAMTCVPVLAATPQSLADINRAVHIAFLAQQAMLTDNNNLLEMRLQLLSSEKDAVDTLTAAANDAFGALDEAITLGQLLHKMVSVEDQDIVRVSFINASAYFVKTADADVESINFSLAKMTTPGARAEAAKIRDKILEAINTLRPFTAKLND